MKHRITAALERFSRAMLAPLSYLSAAGLLLVVGALLTSAPLAGVLPFLRWEPVQLAGRILYKCLTAVISNLSVLFCTGLAAALAKREKHQAAFIALMSYLVYLTAGNVTLTELGLLAQPDGLTGLYGAGQTSVLGIQTVDTGVFGGVLLGTGGLVRAYSGAVKEGIAASKIGTMRYGVRLKIYTDYNGIGRIQYILRQNGLEAEDTVYTDQVELTVLLAAECVPGLKKEITEATAAKAGIEEVEKLYFVAPDA